MGQSVRFLDAAGRWWEVHETSVFLETADAPRGRAGRLYFFCGQATLKLERYPSGWEALSGPELENLRRHATALSSMMPSPARSGAPDAPTRDHVAEVR